MVVRSEDAATRLRRLFDPEDVFVAGMMGSLMARRFSGIVVTIRPEDFVSALERQKCQCWLKEYLPTKLAHGHQDNLVML